MSTPNLQIELGGFTDAFGTPLAGGYLLITLNHDENTSIPNQVASGLTLKVLLDNNGSIPVSPQTLIWSNDVLTPANSYYTVLGYKRDGTLSWGPQYWQLAAAPNPLNVGTIVPVNPVGGFGGSGGGGGGGGSSLTLQTNAVNNSNQALLNLSQGSGITLANLAGTTTITATVPASVTLQTNSVSNSNQALLNLAQGTGITVSNVAGTTTIASTGVVGGGGVFATAGQGYFWSNGQTNTPFITNSLNSYNTIVVNNNEVNVFQFTLLAAYTIRSVSFITGGNGSSHNGFGIYSAAGAKLIDTGAFNNGSVAAGQPVCIAITPVTLLPAVYYLASTCDDNLSAYLSVSIVQGTGGNNSINSLLYPTWFGSFPNPQPGGGSIPLYGGVAANPSVAGALPATLGAISAMSGGTTRFMPIVLFSV